MFDIISWWLAIANFLLFAFLLPVSFPPHNSLFLSENRLCTRKEVKISLIDTEGIGIGISNSLCFHFFGAAVNCFDVTVIYSFVIETRVRCLFALGNLFLFLIQNEKEENSSNPFHYLMRWDDRKKFIQSFRNGWRRMSRKRWKCLVSIYSGPGKSNRGMDTGMNVKEINFLETFCQVFHSCWWIEIFSDWFTKKVNFFISSASERFSRSFCRQAQVYDFFWTDKCVVRYHRTCKFLK